MNMVEKVAAACANDEWARAIANKGGTVKFDDMEAETQDFWRHIARAALEAMREPTREQCEAGYRAMLHTDFTGPQEKNCWQAMIDAALNPTGEGR